MSRMLASSTHSRGQRAQAHGAGCINFRKSATGLEGEGENVTRFTALFLAIAAFAVVGCGNSKPPVHSQRHLTPKYTLEEAVRRANQAEEEKPIRRKVELSITK